MGGERNRDFLAARWKLADAALDFDSAQVVDADRQEMAIAAAADVVNASAHLICCSVTWRLETDLLLPDHKLYARTDLRLSGSDDAMTVPIEPGSTGATFDNTP